jgi:hypothetical protein
MRTLTRVLTFGFISGLLWSIVPGTLAELFSSRDVLATVVAGIFSGVATSVVIGMFLERVGRPVTLLLGLVSLPFGAFVFGFALALIDRFFPGITSGSRAIIDPWTLGASYAVLSVISIFAVGLFPLAVLTTLGLRSWVIWGRNASPAH